MELLAKKSKELPGEVKDLLANSKVGHLSTVSPQGRISIVPVGFYFAGRDVFFGTPKESAKLKFLKKNPNVSMTVDNGLIMKEALGVLIQGKAEIFDVKDTFKRFKETIPTIAKFSKKYPELFTFYTTHMSDLPEDRKFYKYRMIRIVTEKMLYWSGYNWGRVFSKKEDYKPFLDATVKLDHGSFAKTAKRFMDIVGSVGFSHTEYGEQVVEYPQEIPEGDLLKQYDEAYAAALDQAMKDGKVTRDEEALLTTIKNNYIVYQDALEQALEDGIITKDEHLMLKTVRRSLYKTAFTTALKDGVITDDEQNILDAFKEKLGLKQTIDIAK
ncbi:MAG: pyridoxamine 5'-phosphate oxidase family protein [Candidatus Hydrothermarchaeales archaeon]